MLKNILDIITPINIKEEHEKFFNSSSYNPQFKYQWTQTDISAFAAKHTHYAPLALAIAAQDISCIVAEGEKIFEATIQPNMLALAKNIVKEMPTLPEENITTEHAHKSFQAALAYFGLDYTFHIISHAGFNFRPNGQAKEIQMSDNINFHFFPLAGLIKHEMVHILRYENGEYNGITKTADYLPTEEGLACFMQDNTPNGNASSFEHAAEYAVTEVALQGSLRDMFTYLCAIGFDPELAWQRAIRHKYGIMDTAQPGDIMKPAMYFYNEQKIKKLSHDAILKLFVGKIAVKDISTTEAYVGSIPEEKLRTFYAL